MRLKVIFVSVAILGSLSYLKADGEKCDSIIVKKCRVEIKCDSCTTQTEKMDKTIDEKREESVCEKRDSIKTNSKIKNSNKKIVVL